jgi:hypothetical protein
LIVDRFVCAVSEFLGQPWGCCDACVQKLLAGWQTPGGSHRVWVEFVVLARGGRVVGDHLDLDQAGLSHLRASFFPFRPSCVLALRLARPVSAEPAGMLELHVVDEGGVLRSWSADALDPTYDRVARRAEDEHVRQPLILGLDDRLSFDRPGRYALVVVADGVTIAGLPIVVSGSTADAALAAGT